MAGTATSISRLQGKLAPRIGFRGRS